MVQRHSMDAILWIRKGIRFRDRPPLRGDALGDGRVAAILIRRSPLFALGRHSRIV